MKIVKTAVENMTVSIDGKAETVAGYSVFGDTDAGRTILLADVMADNHPALDAETHKDLGTPTLEEAREIADLIASRMAA
ncbi:hypothetical protein [Azospirillum sp. TSO5]|uniref:hypothetical protein n=1 Tax=Azospirillum sp. TSO5 TaxID=716760 RepID=UPI000D613A20|nr:hypothetical protein [Azospirillum sp. TSO5]PWC95450.1 hypothetical protein TSO5_10510 [Azospirillum sp. TSO5]